MNLNNLTSSSWKVDGQKTGIGGFISSQKEMPRY